MAKSRTRVKALTLFVLIAAVALAASLRASAFDMVEFAWPIVGSAQLTISGNPYDLTFAETVNLTTKTDLVLNLNLGKWRNNLTMSFMLKNGNLPSEGVLKIGQIGIYLDRWRIVSIYDKLTITAGDTAAPSIFTRYMSGSSLYGASMQAGGTLPGALKDTNFTITGMGGKNSTSRGISSTTMDVAGLALEFSYLKSMRYSVAYTEGLRPGTDIKLGSAMFYYNFDTNAITLDGAYSYEAVSGKQGWTGSVNYSGNFQRKVALTSNLSYTSGQFTRIAASSPSSGGVVTAAANLTVNLAPVWKGSETVGIKTRFTKDNIEATKPSSISSFDASISYSASGFAPSASASASYALAASSNDLTPKTVSTIKHSLDLRYSYQANIEQSRLSVSMNVAPSVSLNKVNDDALVAVSSGLSASLYAGSTNVTGKAEMRVTGAKLSETMTFAPSLSISVSTSFAKPAISMGATISVSNSSTLNYGTSTITSDVSYLEIDPNISWRISESFSIYAKYSGKLRFGTSVPNTTWIDTFSMGLGFKL